MGKEFMTTAQVRLTELEDLFTDMKARFDRVCRLFSEDPTTTQSDEFFGIFDYFISSFEEARDDNENVKKKKEEEEKIAKQHQEMRMRNPSPAGSAQECQKSCQDTNGWT